MPIAPVGQDHFDPNGPTLCQDPAPSLVYNVLLYRQLQKLSRIPFSALLLARIPHHLANDRPPPTPRVEIHQDDLLPGPKNQAPAFNRHGKGGPQQRGPDVGVPVIIVPGLLVLIAGGPGRDALESRLNIVIGQSRLELGRRNPGRRADVEKRHHTIGKPCLAHCLSVLTIPYLPAGPPVCRQRVSFYAGTKADYSPTPKKVKKFHFF